MSWSVAYSLGVTTRIRHNDSMTKMRRLETKHRIPGAAAGWATACGLTALMLLAQPAAAREVGAPIKLAWVEGDVAGFTSILSADGSRTIGYVDYRQHLEGNVLTATRISRFDDGSSDEDTVEARVDGTLRSSRGRMIIRDTNGAATLDVSIDVERGRLFGFSGLGKDRQEYDLKVKLSEGTYWGPLIAVVIKNFDANAAGESLIFPTVIVTPKPRLLDMEVTGQGKTKARRAGAEISALEFSLRPTVNWLIDPILRAFTPEASFLIQTGAPPAFIRFAGPRNYAGQEVRIE